MNVFSEPLRELEAYNFIKQTLEGQDAEGSRDPERACSVLADSCVDPQKAHLLYSLCR